VPDASTGHRRLATVAAVPPSLRRPSRAWRPAVLLVLVAAACSSGDFDREGAVETVLARYSGRLTREQAECYVDRVVDELGTTVLDTDAPTPEQIPRLTRIRVDCTGVASLGTSVPPPTRERRTGGGTAPQRPGDDAGLDALHASCAEGSGAACDQLFDEAPIGSDYEQFALTCGDRTSEVRCADKYQG
jgi:hypothetical protein